MSEIKFACPYCSQHVTCDAQYGDALIDCPACGNEMVVPRLNASDSAHPSMLVVASRPGPKRSTSGAGPTVRAMSESEWAEHHGKFGQSDKTAPLWMVSVVAALIIGFVLKANGAGIWPVVICLVAGTGLSAFLMFKDLRSSAAHSVLKGLSIVLALCVFIPVIAIGILFIGCMGCH